MDSPHITNQPKTYRVGTVTDSIAITGKGDHPCWKTTHILTDFSYPWEAMPPPPTKFKALHNTEWLYCLFDITDPDVNLFRETDDKWEVASSSRAEIFFRTNDALSPYYCLEIDPAGRILDYKGHYYRKFDTDWSWPKGHLHVKTAQTDKGYTIELAISKHSLTDLALLTRNILQVGLFRATCSLKDKDNPDLRWISWITPDAETPDFHIPSAFGIFQLG